MQPDGLLTKLVLSSTKKTVTASLVKEFGVLLVIEIELVTCSPITAYSLDSVWVIVTLLLLRAITLQVYQTLLQKRLGRSLWYSFFRETEKRCNSVGELMGVRRLFTIGADYL